MKRKRKSTIPRRSTKEETTCEPVTLQFFLFSPQKQRAFYNHDTNMIHIRALNHAGAKKKTKTCQLRYLLGGTLKHEAFVSPFLRTSNAMHRV
jgi:hypothetical protein